MERDLFRALIPHLRRALILHARLGRMETERALYAGAVAQLSVATIILDEQGKVLNTNPLAAELLAHSKLIRLQGDSLVLSSREQTRELRALVASLVETQRRGETGTIEALRIPRGDDGPDMGLVIRPIPLNEWSEGQSVPSVAIFISVPDQIAEAPVQVITRLFGFTPTEATLALLLANGLSLDEAAADMGISRNTARTHLRALFSKTGVTRQTLLVRLILKSVAALA
ncbi:MAG: LuxR C-terminal-related transcriptional regulator [Spongiibacteraceae bacterium]|nr:LuxR C-terminal-related transcriptional regulator [Spongiibacteraceae bacterium]